jgi:hypothetical protein
MSIADKLQKFEIFVYDEPHPMSDKEIPYWYN